MREHRGRTGESRPRPGERQQAVRRRAGQARRRPVLRTRVRLALACVAAVVVLGGGWLWVRDSPLVAVDRVSVTGATGPDAAQIRQALVSAAHNMTTLDVHMSELRNAVAPFSVVKQLRVSTQFPHAIRIRVLEETPVGAVQFDGQTVAVAADGRLLSDSGVASSLPLIALRTPPGGRRLTDPQALGAVALLGAAPPALLPHVSEVATIAPHGLVAQIRNGPAIYFGDLTTLQAKWVAASEVLANPGSAGCAYIDVTDPRHPAAGSQVSGSGASATGAGGVATGGTAAAAASPTVGATTSASGPAVGATGSSQAGAGGVSAGGSEAGATGVLATGAGGSSSGSSVASASASPGASGSSGGSGSSPSSTSGGSGAGTSSGVGAGSEPGTSGG